MSFFSTAMPINRLLSRPSRFLFLPVLLFSLAATGQMTIEITGAGARQIPIAIADFGGDSAAARAISIVVREDLARSGLFRLVSADGMPMHENSAVDYDFWRDQGADALATGSLSVGANGRLEARFRLHDINRKAGLGGAVYSTEISQLRAAGHRVADAIYEKLTGERGIFATRIA
ncbi:MAG: Tol-Pal system protein TolB, partial [Zoogloeaceae bacterium]|nr:Tol-Pal system protein TolB [Zoogloeaceae bacterium]